ncbi:CD82 antigen-like [Convolutriloba macropyga]|uniref:CD82 antigen-like n=1 Tax=Convolutriloba macropyga TaxID=536237 RepID=UPI003F520FC9
MCGTIIDFVAKVILFVTNIITLIVSVGILAGLIYAIVGVNIVELLDVFGSTDMSISLYSMLGFLVVLIITSLLGLFGVCCKSKFMLGLYAVILMMCLLGLGILTVLFFLEGDKIMENAREQMRDTIKYEYEGDYTKAPISVAWNLIQYQLGTCGVDSFTDYVYSEWYNGTFSSNTFDNSGTVYTIPYPVSCCDGGDQYVSLAKVISGDISTSNFDITWVQNCFGITDYGNGTYTIDSTSQTPNNKGSIDEVKTVLKASIYVVAGVAGGIVLLQLVLVWAGCRLIDSPRFGKKKVEDTKE